MENPNQLSSLRMIFVVSVLIVAIATFSLSASVVQQIKPEELKKLIESQDPNILVVDTQPKVAYDFGHIKGAINFPWARDIKSPRTLPKDKMLVLYCDCGQVEDSADVIIPFTSKSDSCSADEDSADLADQLMTKFGYTNIKVLEGGWSEWLELGYPVEKSD